MSFGSGIIVGWLLAIITYAVVGLISLWAEKGEANMGIGAELEKVGEDVLHVIEWPFKNAVEVSEFIADTIKDEPAVKQAIGELITQAKPVLSDLGDDVAEKGLNLPEDVQTLQDLQAFGSYFKNTFLPVIVAAYKDYKGIVDASASSTTTSAAASPAQATATAQVQAQTGPGLHTVVPE